MKAILSADLNWGIGNKGKLLVKIPEDMKRFKEKTIGNVVVMGRKTFESLPDKKPLKDRINIVMSKKKDFEAEGILKADSINDVFHILHNFKDKDVFVIGGESVYKQFMDFYDEIFVTKIKKNFCADRFFINMDKIDGWKIENEQKCHIYRDILYSFINYKKI